jgi:hypothetical protein
LRYAGHAPFREVLRRRSRHRKFSGKTEGLLSLRSQTGD